MQRWKWPVIIAAGASLIAFVAWPYVTAYRLKAAVRSGDTAALADLIEFPTLRQGLKEQLNAAMLARLAAEPGGDGGLLAGLGLALAGTFIDKAVDAYVTPAGVARLVAGDPLELQAGDRSAAGEAAADGAVADLRPLRRDGTGRGGQSEPVRAAAPRPRLEAHRHPRPAGLTPGGGTVSG